MGMLAVSIGIYSAVPQYSIGDSAATFIGFLGLAIPGNSASRHTARMRAGYRYAALANGGAALGRRGAGQHGSPAGASG